MENPEKPDLLERKWLPYVLIAGAVLLVYSRTFFFDFTYLDDDALILNNMAFIGHPGNALAAFSRDAFNGAGGGAAYRPLLLVSFIGDAFLGGSAPFIYHFTNVVLHALACMALFAFLRAWTCGALFSLMASLFFAVHPALNQAVAWIPGRNDVLLALFSLLSFTSFMNFLDKGKRADLGLNALFYACALFTKETAVVLPFFLAAYALALRRDLPRRAVLRAAAVWLGITALWFCARAAALNVPVAGGRYHIARSLYENSAAILPYLGKVFFPFNLSVMPVLKDMSLLPGLAALLLLAAALYLRRNAEPRKTIFALLWFLFWLLPSFIRPAGLPPDFTEHRGYVPFIGLLLFAADLTFVRRGLLLGLSWCVIALFAGISASRLDHFRDRLNFWENAAATSPGSLMNRTKLGAAYYEKGRYVEAGVQWSKALEMAPDDPVANANMGAIRFAEGRTGEAAALWEKALELDPGNLQALSNLAVLNYERKDHRKTALYVRELLARKAPVHPSLLAATKKYR